MPNKSLGRRLASPPTATLLRALLAVLWFSTTNSASASDAHTGQVSAEVGQVVIDIPPGFSGPQRTFPTAQTEMNVYVSADRPPNILQVSRITVPDAANDLSEKDRYGAASNFLQGFLGTFAPQVKQWSQSPIEQIRLDGFLAARARWTGNLHGFPANGAMYFLVLGKDSYVFHAFGTSAEPNAALKSSIQSIEGLRMKRANNSPERKRDARPKSQPAPPAN